MSDDEQVIKKGSMKSNVVSVQLDLADANLINKITKQDLIDTIGNLQKQFQEISVANKALQTANSKLQQNASNLEEENKSLNFKYNKLQKESTLKPISSSQFPNSGDDSDDTNRSISKIHKLDSNTPKFHGNANEDVDDWLYKIQINFRLASIPEKLYVDYLTNYCLGKAGIFLRRLRDSYEKKFESLSWKLLQKEFIQRYRPIDHERKIVLLL